MHEHLRRTDLPLYPKAFISATRLSKERDRVFVAMPFRAEHTDELWKILQGVGEIYGFNIHRVDQRVEPNAIVSDILDEMERAEIIIADLTGLNPNVLYEVGIAHVRCDSVIILSQQGQELPFDLANIRCIFFDLSSREGKIDLAERLGRTLSALRTVGPPTVIESKIERTKTIINDLLVLNNLSDEDLSKEVVWHSGSLSAFSIDSTEPFQPEEEDYKRTLIEEKDTLHSRFILYDRIDVINIRLRCLLQFLESKDNSLQNTEWVVSPFRQKNLYIIGNISCLEGYKKGIQRGFGLTLRQTDLNAISASISLYKVLFSHQETYTMATYGNSGNIINRRDALREATINCLKKSIEILDCKDEVIVNE